MAFAELSSLKAFAAGLLYERIDPREDVISVFESLLSAINSASRPQRIYKYTDRFRDKAPSLETTFDDIHWQSQLRQTIARLFKRRDYDGRSLIHYIAAYKPGYHDLNLGGTLRDLESVAVYDCRIRTGEHIRTCDERVDNERLNTEAAAVWEQYLDKKKRRVGEIIQWALTIDGDVASCTDKDGLDPFQYAVSKGKTWADGLEHVAKRVPGWTKPRGDASLCPFAMAACSLDLDTAFELLRLDPSVLEPSVYEVEMKEARVDNAVTETLASLERLLISHPDMRQRVQDLIDQAK